MSNEFGFRDGYYVTPQIGHGTDRTFPESRFYVLGGEFGIDSVLWNEKKLFRDIFPDPRSAHFVDAVVRHQFHHLDTRQLSLPERFETRSGAGRMNRLTTLVESAGLVAYVGGTFEQIVQVMMSDINVTVGSHRLGDHLEGDYALQSTRDEDIADYARRSSLSAYLQDRQLIDTNGVLAGSPVSLYALSSPNMPRRFDIVERPRPYSNADRDPFNLYEGLYLFDTTAVQAAIRSMVRVEVPTERGSEETFAYTNIEAAELQYIAGIRHATEHWGNPEHHFIEELVSSADKYRFMYLWPYLPVDYARTSESSWFMSGTTDAFTEQTYIIAERMAKVIREITWDIQSGKQAYKGPGTIPIPTVHFRKLTKPAARPIVEVERDTRYDTKARLTVIAPTHKRRLPIDPLVLSKTGLEHLTEIEPEIVGYADRQMKHLGSWAITAELPWDDIGQLQAGLANVRKSWNPRGNAQPEPLLRTPMDSELLSKQIDEARLHVKQCAYRPV